MCLEYKPSLWIQSHRSSTHLSVSQKSHTLALGSKDIHAVRSASICVALGQIELNPIGLCLCGFEIVFVIILVVQIQQLSSAAQPCDQYGRKKNENNQLHLVLEYTYQVCRCYILRLYCFVENVRICSLYCCALQSREEFDLKLLDSTVIMFRLAGNSGSEYSLQWY